MLKEIKRLSKLLEINKKGIVVRKTGIKESDNDIIRGFHGTDFMPDDFRFSTINTLLLTMIDYEIDSLDKIEDVRFEIIENTIDVYNIDLLNWLASNLKRVEYCDEALNSGFCTNEGDRSLIDTIRAGQHLEIDEILNNIISHLETL